MTLDPAHIIAIGTALAAIVTAWRTSGRQKHIEEKVRRIDADVTTAHGIAANASTCANAALDGVRENGRKINDVAINTPSPLQAASPASPVPPMVVGELKVEAETPATIKPHWKRPK